jgi:N-acetylmuramoyl-L-alanine amidase
MPKHVVQRGEGLTSIADIHGFFARTLWNHPDNAALRAKRADPDILAPGDELFIPERRDRVEDCATTARHRFRKKGVPAFLRLQVIVGDEIRANQPYELTIDGVVHRGTTNAQGILDEGVPPRSRSAVLKVGPDQHEFYIRLYHVDPVETVSGVRSRLNNLGFACGTGTDPDTALEHAVRRFQRKAGVTVNGRWDDSATAAALQRFHETSEIFSTEPPEEGR